MMIKFWIGIILSILIMVALMVSLGYLTKKRKSGPAGGALIGFFVGIAFVFVVFFTASRVYVVKGDGDYVHYMVFFGPEYEMPNGEIGNLSMEYDQCFVINEWEKPVIIEEVKYGGYGFSGSTQWVKAGDYEIIDNHKIDYFYDDKPPSEISVRGSSTDEVVRKWMRNKR